MWKFKRMFSLVAVLAAVGLFLPACESTTPDPEPDPTPKAYSVTVEGGAAWWYDEEIEEPVLIPNGKPLVYENDTLYITLLATPPAGQEFLRWDVTPSRYNDNFWGDDRYEEIAEFYMPAANVTIKAVYQDKAGFSVEVQSNVGYVTLSGDGIYEEGDEVTISVTGIPSYRTFMEWTSNNEDIEFEDETAETTTFIMPASDVIVKAWFEGIDGLASIRFVWESMYNDAEDNEDGIVINYIMASEEGMDWWLKDVYMAEDIVDEDFSHEAKFNGNPFVDEYDLFKSGNELNGAWWDTDAESYTAVLSFSDEFGDFEIVSNYTVEINPAEDHVTDGADRFWELAFDITGTLEHLYDEDSEHYGWFVEVSGMDAEPGLTKRKARAGMRKLSTTRTQTSWGTVEVTQYLLFRPKN